MIYPQWNVDGTTFVGMTAPPNPPPNPKRRISPQSTWYTIEGDVVSGSSPSYENLNGFTQASDTLTISVNGGMPAITKSANAMQSAGLPCIVFAGQAFLGSVNPDYQQNENYIFCNWAFSGQFYSQPLEFGQVTQSFQKQFQGRAPNVSPLGSTIVFESNRAGATNSAGDIYALYICNVTSNSGGNTSVQITSTDSDNHQDLCGGNAQHAKFYMGGKRIVFCSHIVKHNLFSMGIATADITQFLTS